MKVQFLFAWYDLWIGLYFDKKNRKLYILPLPMIGIIILFSTKDTKSDKILSNEREGLGKHEYTKKINPIYCANIDFLECCLRHSCDGCPADKD